jgi:hypothetical protein
MPERLVGLKAMDRRVAALAAAANRNPAAECRVAVEWAMGLAAADREGLTLDRAVMFRSKAVAECLTGRRARTVVAIVVYPRTAATGAVLERSTPEGLRHRDPTVGDASARRVRHRVAAAGQLVRTTGRKRAVRRKALKETLPAAGSTAIHTPAAPAIDGRPCRVGARNSAIPMDEPSGPICAVR